MSSGSPPLAQFFGHECINLETYRKSGEPVRTPVWFTIDDGGGDGDGGSGKRIFVVTKSETGKVKRLRNNQNARIMPCGMRGEPKGEWVAAKVRRATPEEQERALAQRKKKYGIKARIAGLFSSGRGELVAFVVEPAGDGGGNY
ncbi:PPOX class F420-dependent oxidoreductase [Nitrososphaera sp.]|uniref:PPOX class F420-dependent oxidoreductase n=1 Tax=Nitrososphaera sp. TaxID=1971748 RepID=UPI00307F2533